MLLRGISMLLAVRRNILVIITAIMAMVRCRATLPLSREASLSTSRIGSSTVSPALAGAWGSALPLFTPRALATFPLPAASRCLLKRMNS